MGLIGFLDSGLGGLSIAMQCKKRLPTWDFLYLGDTANAPYGNKNSKAIAQLTEKGVERLVKQGVDAIVLACSTACATASPHLQKECSVPLFGVIEPGVDFAFKTTKGRSIAVLATKATVDANAYQRAFQQFDRSKVVLQIACPLLASQIDQGLIDHPSTATLLKDYLQTPDLMNCEAILLGCTHFAFAKAQIKRICHSIEILDPAPACADRIAQSLAHSLIKKNVGKGLWSWDFTDDPFHWRARALQFLELMA